MVDDDTGRLSATGYIVSQRDFMDDLEFAFGAFKTYQVPLATIEGQTGLDFGSLRDHDPLAEIETLSFRPLEMLAEIVT
jgi:endonuclease G